jgi:oligopeptide transport system substrate-binding protein
MAPSKGWNRRLTMAGGTAAVVAGGYFAFRRPADSGFKFSTADARTFHRGNAAEPETLDPHKSSTIWEDNIIGDMMVGLMHQDAAGRPIPCACESYSRSADGLTATFRLRDHVWSDGVKVTAHDYVFSFRRIADPKTAAQYVAILYPIKNMQEAASGKLPPEAVGVRALDDRTLQVEFIFQVPYIAELFMHATTYAVPRHVVEKHGDAWLKPENIAVNGPYILKEWVPNGHIRVDKNPRFYDAANVPIEHIFYYPTQDALAGLKRFRAGELDISYHGIPLTEIALLRRTMPRELSIGPLLGNYFLVLNFTRKPFDDVRVRTALSLAVDREVLVDKVQRAGQRAAYGIIPYGMPDYPYTAQLRFRPLPMPARIAKAKTLLAEAGFGPDNPLTFDMSIYNRVEWKLTCVALQAMWRAVGVQMRILSLDSQILYATLRRHDFAVASAGWLADYADPKNFLFLFQSNNKDLNYSAYSSPRFDGLVSQSDHIRDAAERLEVLAQAEQVMLDDVAAIPLFDDVTRDLVSPQVKGWIGNPTNFNRTRWLSLDRGIHKL